MSSTKATAGFDKESVYGCGAFGPEGTHRVSLKSSVSQGSGSTAGCEFTQGLRRKQRSVTHELTEICMDHCRTIMKIFL